MTDTTTEQTLYNAEMAVKRKATLLKVTENIKAGDLFASGCGVFTPPQFFQVIEKKDLFVTLQKINHKKTKVPTQAGVCITPIKNDFTDDSKPIRRKLKNRRNGVNGKYFPAKNGNYFPAVSGK